MGLNIYPWSNSYSCQSHEYIVLRTIRSPYTVDLHHKEHPRLLPDNPRNRALDSNAMVLPPLTSKFNAQVSGGARKSKERTTSKYTREEGRVVTILLTDTLTPIQPIRE
jgi:hypothetical protein